MSQLIFASHNENKTKEIRALLKTYEVLSLRDLNFTEEIPETGASLEENAAIKARRIFEEYGRAVFADDTGLIVPALGGAPGVYSARYAGPEANAEANMDKLLVALLEEKERAAYFETVICYIDDKGSEYLFRGRVDGQILMSKQGLKGFGYDPIFKPAGYQESFAEMPAGEKNRISHRGRALEAFIQFLRPATQKS